MLSLTQISISLLCICASHLAPNDQYLDFSSYYFWLCSRGAPKHISGIASLIIVVIFQLIRPYLASSKRKDQQTLIRKSDCCSCVATASGNKTYYPMLQTIRKINRRALLKLKSCKVAHLLKLSC